MITPIFTDRAGYAIGFMPIGQALMELEMDREDWEDPIHHDETFFPIEDMIATNIIGEEVDKDGFTLCDFSEDALIDLIDRGIPFADAFRNQDFCITRYFCINPDNHINAWHDPSFHPADAIHSIHRNGNLYFLSKAQRRTIKTWDVEVIAA